MRFHLVLPAVLAAGLLVAPVWAQGVPVQAPVTLDAAARKAAIAQTSERLRREYVFPDVGVKVADALDAAAASGAYDTLDRPAAFAQRVNADMAAIAHDKHLRIRTPGMTPDRPAIAPPARSEFGVVRADRLDGGIGYLEVDGFPPSDSFKPALDKAMATLAGSRALIVDMRRNGGGSPDGVAYLVSQFLDPKTPVLLTRIINRIAGSDTFNTQEVWSRPTATSFLGKPVYVLTSGYTFSGGEGFAYDMQVFKLGVLVGETTGGGAHPGGTRPVGPQMQLFMPAGRSENPVTKSNWEGVGVIPDIKVPAGDALKTALVRLGQQPASGDINVLSWARLFTPGTTAQPGALAAAQRLAKELRDGAPSYDQLADGVARMVRNQSPRLRQDITALGDQVEVSFTEVDRTGMNVFRVKGDKDALDMGLYLDQDGKVVILGLRAPQTPTPSDAQRMAAFTEQDRNSDGRLDKAEYLALMQQLGFATQADSLFAQRDRDKDGFVSMEEYRPAI